ncbi:hypothetical protein [Fuerstiella marisgermanici]|uniref:Uncharacterized protein n=1 Tax=Fuerstiella marisgermanici TaxID=1891926 RepID=A0A1P8WGE2_9PLAN|nr:hypothetical protein [Fuerstiella marisgermanici]APZ93128.1 hypothetical protein Fuma_02744 [Fuerstiella marisgermanici]
MLRLFPVSYLASLVLLAACLPVSGQDYGGMLPTGSITSGYSSHSDSAIAVPYTGVSLPSNAQVEEPFDYRFDRQYNSTVKPYLRWYMRQSPEVQREYYHRFRQMYGYRIYHIPCLGNCGIHYKEIVIDMMPEIPRRRHNAALEINAAPPFEKRDRNNATPKLEYSPFLERELLEQRLRDYEGEDTSSNSSPDHGAGSLRAKTVWVSRDKATGAQSVLYQQPAETSAQDFYRGIAQISSSGKILNVRWSQTPPWVLESQVAEK